MNRAKQSGKNRVELFATEMRADALARLQLEVDLRRAIEREEFQNFYQPIVDLRTGKLAGFESLIRWRHPSRGILLPKDFVPMAEENLLIIPIDQWVLHSACAQLQEWRSRYDLQMLTIHVNVSGRHFMQPTLVEEVERTLVKSRLPGSCLHLEITEGTVIVDPEAAISIMTRLKQLGAHLSLDDFGTGYSSLSYLSRFPLDSLKIDMSFTRGICTNQENLQIAQVILALAKGLGLRAIAEGVETAEQCDKLRSIGCEYAQGYYFGRPASTDSTEELIRQGKSW
jgi:EAL domain-containing protein (putative c-di-GMP-specific phosphodiesterase class I)